jgi:hypothetical protein
MKKIQSSRFEVKDKPMEAFQVFGEIASSWTMGKRILFNN